MYGTILRKCRRCGHRVPWAETIRYNWSDRRTWVCPECYRELVKQDTGYEQGEFEFGDESFSHKNDLPF